MQSLIIIIVLIVLLTFTQDLLYSFLKKKLKGIKHNDVYAIIFSLIIYLLLAIIVVFSIPLISSTINYDFGQFLIYILSIGVGVVAGSIIGYLYKSRSGTDAIRVAVMDRTFNQAALEKLNCEINTYNSVEGDDVLSTTYDSSKNLELELLENNTLIDKENNIRLTLISIEDKKHQVKDQYIVSALEYLMDIKTEIILILISSKKMLDLPDKMLNELASRGIIIISPQNLRDDPIYPGQNNNVLSVSTIGEGDDKKNAKVNLQIPKDPYHNYSTIEAAVYATNIIMNSYKKRFRQNIKHVLKKRNQTIQEVLDELNGKNK